MADTVLSLLAAGTRESREAAARLASKHIVRDNPIPSPAECDAQLRELEAGRQLLDDAMGDRRGRPPQFVNVGASVMRGAETIATCRSVTMAKRIAAALNWYRPGPRGA